MRTSLTFLMIFLGLCHLQLRAQEVVFQQELKGEVFPIGHLLRWQTSSETPGIQFVLERSTDGLNFHELARLQGKGNPSEQNDYQFLVADVVEDILYYRVRVEQDKQPVASSAILSMRNDVANQFAILRFSDILPATTFDVEVLGRARGMINWQVRHLRQDHEEHGQWVLDLGVNDYQLDLSNLPEGPCQLTLQFGEERETLTIRKVVEEPIRSLTAGSDPLPINQH